MLPKEIFDPRKSKTRDPKRKFAAKEYLMEISRYTRITDLKTQKIMDLERAVDKFGIIDVQLLDFAGSIFLDTKDWDIQIGFNRLFSTNELNNDSILLEHKLKLSRYMRSFHHQEAMAELEQILKFGESSLDKFTEFRYICLKGRILMRSRKLAEAKNEFEKAFTLLDTKFFNDESELLTIHRINRMKSGFSEPNWDTELIDYDEIMLNYFYSHTLSWRGSADETSKLITILNSTLVKADKYQSSFDLINTHERLFDIYNILGNYESAIHHITNAISTIKEHDLLSHDEFLYGNLHQSLIETLVRVENFVLAQQITDEYNNRITEKNNFIGRYFYLKSIVTIFEGKADLRNAFKNRRKMVNLYYNEITKFGNVSKLFLIKDIFHYIIQGIELQKFANMRDIEEYYNFIKNTEENKSITMVYLNLISVSFQIKDILENDYNREDITQIENFLKNILEKTRSDTLRYCLTVIIYYRFLFQQLDSNENIIEKIANLTSDTFDTLNSSNYTLMILQNEIIKQLVEGKTSRIKLKLTEIQEMYHVTEISRFIDLISDFESGSLNLKNTLTQLIQNDFRFSTFEKCIIYPINSIPI